jgi:demethylmenaquinone methyltransferase/2-methoxy-6-polyprenyl-1,4-benzoquinol methylase
MSEQVHDMFSEIAPSYDATNTVLSLGVHHLWRKKTVELSEVSPGDDVLDCATGTGDLAIAYKKAVGDDGRVVGTDFNADMLSFAPEKAEEAGLEIEWEVQDAMDLTYEDDTFDIASIAFGIRNVDDPAVALESMARVVRPGGRVVVLEFGEPTGIMKPLYKFYNKFVLPTVGGIMSGNREAYSYLQETSIAFPCRDDFLDLMESTGSFSEQTYHSLTGGIAYIYVGTVA